MNEDHPNFSAHPKAERDSAEIYWNGKTWTVDKDKVSMSFKSFNRALAWAELEEEEENHE